MKGSERKLAIAGLIISIVTAIALISQTFILRGNVNEAKKQSEILNKNLITSINDSFIRNRPFVYIEITDVYGYIVDKEKGIKKIHMNVNFKNVGNSPATIKEISWENYAGKEKRPSLQEWIESQGGKLNVKTLFPSQTIPLGYRPDVGSLESFKLNVTILYDGADGKGYWYSSNVEYKLFESEKDERIY